MSPSPSPSPNPYANPNPNPNPNPNLNPNPDQFCYEILKLARVHMHMIDIRVCATSAVDPLLYKQLLDQCAANKKEWTKAQKALKKKGGKGGKGGKKKK